MTLDSWAKSQADRCTHGYAANQHPSLCACAGLALKDRGQSIATAAHPDDRAAVDAAIRQAAATRRPFSANSIRHLHGVKGGVVGAAFGAAYKAGLIEPCGDETSTSTATHGHRVYLWKGVAA